MKTTKKHFQIFKDECKKWQDVFHLNGFDLRIDWKKTSENRAEIDICSLNDGIIIISLGKEITPDEDCTNEVIKVAAKHEMIHALLAEYTYMACRRFVNKDEEYKLAEKLVNKLMKLIE